jgi:serine-type D-Ala-D-Ala carboxypeptidase/endopeptidase (penicillin-binding protein 4)
VLVSIPEALLQIKRYSKRKTQATDAAQRFTRRVDGVLRISPASKGEWGLLIVDAGSGETLYEQNSTKYFSPASNMKLFTTALAFEKLGPDYRFRTTLESAGAITPQGELTSDLLLVGRGDPNLSNRKLPFDRKEEFEGPPEIVLAELADKLVAKGVKNISGDVIGDDSYFAREPYPNGWEVGDIVWGYGAAISALAVNDNTAMLTLTPGQKAGEAVKTSVIPQTSDFTVDNRVSTSAARVRTRLALTREPGAHLIVVSGTLPKKSAPIKLVVGIEEPAIYAATVLRALLEERGITIRGGVKARHDYVSAYAGNAQRALAEHVSIPLRDSLNVVNKISQNLHAELLLRTAMRESAESSSPDEPMTIVADFYTGAGIIADDVIQTDGSGLSRQDLVTPRAVVTLLRYAESQPWFGYYYTSLPVAGIDGTLEQRMKNTLAAGRIHAKTGSSEHARTLSGFAETPSGRRLIFSFLGNNQYGNNQDSPDALEGLCVAMIEEFNSVSP